MATNASGRGPVVAGRAFRISVLLTVVAVVGGVSFLVPGRARGAASPITAVLTASGAAGDLNKIKHVVMIMQENRSFDHYFGQYPGADGPPPDACIPNPDAGGCSLLYHDANPVNYGGPHSINSSTLAMDDGKMDGFVRAWEVRCHEKFIEACRNHGTPSPDVLGYKLRSDIPNYWAYADQFVLHDHMFPPTFSWSLPEHLNMVSAWSAACAVRGDPLSCRNEVTRVARAPDHHPAGYAWTDITYLMAKNSISWGYYVFTGTEPDCTDPAAMECVPVPQDAKTPSIWNPLPQFDTVQSAGQQTNIQTVDNFVAAVDANAMPAVSWIVPTKSVSEHPPSNVHDGESYTTFLINKIMQSPEWDSTAIFVAWDDWGGFYDHLTPPSIDGNPVGIRVPSLVISAYAKQGFVDHATYTFDSYLRFIEDRFLGGSRLDPATDGRPDLRPTVRENAPQLGDLRDDFDFTQAPRPPVILPTVAADRLAAPIHPAMPSSGSAAGSVPIVGTAPFTADFDGSQSTDTAGPISHWMLQFGDGTSTSGSGPPPAHITHTYSSAASVIATLTVSDHKRNTDRDSLAVYVNDPSAAAWLSATPVTGYAPTITRFDGSASAAGDWTISFGDGTPDASGTGTPPTDLSHTYDTPGGYAATITTVAAGGLIGHANIVVNVLPAAAPTARTTLPELLPGGNAVLHGTVDTNGPPTSYWFEWGATSTLGSSSTPALVDPNAIEPDLTFALNGLVSGTTNYFRIVASNSLGTRQGPTRSFKVP